MGLRRTARVLIAVSGVLLVWYVLANDILNPRRGRSAVEGPGSLAGRVTFDGEPCEALVEVRTVAVRAPSLRDRLELPFGPDLPVSSTGTDEDGEYEFDSLPAGRHEIIANGPEGTVARTWVTVGSSVPGARADLALETGTGGLAARAILSSGAAFDGLVLAYTRGNPEGPTGTWTPAVQPDESGRLEIRGFPRRRAALAFLRPGELRVLAPGVEIGEAGERLFVVDAGLEDRAGRIVDEDGSALAGAGVFVRSRDPATGREAIHAARTEESGRFVSRAFAELLEYAVAADGFILLLGGRLPDGDISLVSDR